MCKQMRCMWVVIAMGLLVSGCAHRLDIKNLQTFQSTSFASLEDRIAIGIVPSTTDIHSQQLVKGIASELGKYSADVLLPYTGGSSKNVDVIAKITVSPQYKGSGWNFLVNFPGFLVWAPAWNGYVYKVNYDVGVSLTKASDSSMIDTFKIPVHLNIRHADINRTWTEISWFEWGVIALVGGLVFTQYDDNVTPLVMQKIEGPVGDYMAQEIVTRINNTGDLSYIFNLNDTGHTNDRSMLSRL